MKEFSIEDKQQYELPKGRDVMVRNFYFRHAEKAIAIIGDVKTGEISKSVISPNGKKESLMLGNQMPELTNQIEVGWSGIERSLETIEAKIEGGQKDSKNIFAKEYPELAGLAPEEWAKLYIVKWEENKRKILEEIGISEKKYPILPPGEQAEISEKAEEPVISEWLDNPNSDLAKLNPPENVAAYIAVLIREDIEKPEKLESGSKLDQLRGTHKTVMEPLLMRALKLENGQKPNQLEDIGGSLGLNDGFEIDLHIDREGKKNLKFIMYRAVRSEPGEGIVFIKKEFDIDLDELNRLADLGIELRNKKEKE